MNATVQPIATPPAGRSLVVRFADRFSIDADKMITTLKATAFRQRPNRDGSVRECSNEELMMLLTICDRYGLDPFTREIFAFLDVKSGAIIPVVSVDGWIRLINERQELQAIEFTYSPETVEHKGKTCHVWIECVISRSDRSAPARIREYFAEVVRKVDFATPWDTHPNRMHRHKALIQAARVSFGFGGIHDDDEAARIIEGESRRMHGGDAPTPAIASINAAVSGTVVPPIVGGQTIEGESVRAGAAVDKETGEVATDAPDAKAAIAKDTGETFAAVMDAVNKAPTPDAVDIASDRIRYVPDAGHKVELTKAAAARRKDLQADDGK